MRMYLENYAKSLNLDPLDAATWRRITHAGLRSKDKVDILLVEFFIFHFSLFIYINREWEGRSRKGFQHLFHLIHFVNYFLYL